MADTNLKSGIYTMGPPASGGDPNSTVCLGGNGNVLFSVVVGQSGSQFVDTAGKTIGQITQTQQQGTAIYDSSNKLVGSIALQQGTASLNDASNKTIATATKDNNSGAINITAPNGNGTIATITISGGTQQGQSMGGGLLGAMGGMGGIGGMGGQNKQGGQGARKSITISVQSQTINSFLLLAFAFSLPKLLGAGSQQKRKGMGGLGGIGGLGAGMLLGGLLGGLGGGLGGGTGGSIGGLGRRRGGFGRR